MTNTIEDAKRYIEMTTPSQATIIIQGLLELISVEKMLEDVSSYHPHTKDKEAG